MVDVKIKGDRIILVKLMSGQETLNIISALYTPNRIRWIC